MPRYAKMLAPNRIATPLAGFLPQFAGRSRRCSSHPAYISWGFPMISHYPLAFTYFNITQAHCFWPHTYLEETSIVIHTDYPCLMYYMFFSRNYGANVPALLVHRQHRPNWSRHHRSLARQPFQLYRIDLNVHPAGCQDRLDSPASKAEGSEIRLEELFVQSHSWVFYVDCNRCPCFEILKRHAYIKWNYATNRHANHDNYPLTKWHDDFGEHCRHVPWWTSQQVAGIDEMLGYVGSWWKLEYGLCQIFINLLGASSVLRSLIQQSFGMVHMVNVYPCLQFFFCEILWDFQAFQALATLDKRRHLECCFKSPRFSQEPRVNMVNPSPAQRARNDDCP